MDERPTQSPLEDLTGVAIIGMAGRFPGAANVGEYWNNLARGVESITFFGPDEIFEGSADPACVRAAPLLDDYDRFDAALFDYSPREASLLDPQHRVFLECAWQALEDAGYDPLNTASRVGVYGGAGGLVRSYGFAHAEQLASENTATGGLAHISNDKDYLTTRVSYKLNLRGPSLTIQTACSTSLVAVHVACQSVLSGECDMALAGGVTIRVPQRAGYRYEEGGIASPDGHCRAFDARAQGTIFGSGAGVVVLKRLADALADGDRVLAVIKGSAVNNDGGSKLSYTAASEAGQSDAIAEALALAGFDPRTIGYVEAHGTGTALGDPVEISALSKAFHSAAARDGQFCAVGSVKTNIGHLEAAAGIAGLIKTVLALVHRQIPASLHFESANPRIDFERGPFFVNTALRAWAAGKTPRRAGVNSLGIGGTNAFVVLEEAPAADISRAPASQSLPPCGVELLCLSAKNDAALAEVARSYAEHLKENEIPAQLVDTCYTAQVGRAQLPERLVVAGDSAQGIREKLEGFLAGKRERGVFRAKSQAMPSIAFLFTGQGSQYAGMGLRLFETEPVFRGALERCDAAARSAGLDTSLLDTLYPLKGVPTPLDETLYTQASLFAIQIALVELWKSWGIEPAIVMGHSAGEYAAAAVAGILSTEDAMTLIVGRGRLLREIREAGAMAAVFADEARVAEALARCGGRASISAVNGPENVAISGDRQAVERVLAVLDRQGIRSWPLAVPTPFHSALMDPILSAFEEITGEVRFARPSLPFVSNLSGQNVKDDFASNARYWTRHMREPVRFEAGMQSLDKFGARLFVEIGPNPTLLNLGKRCLTGADRGWFMSLRNGRDDQQQMVECLGELWAWGARPRWDQFQAGRNPRRTQVPGYPFQRQRYWLEAADGPRRERALEPSRRSSLPGRRVSSPLREVQFESRIGQSLVPLVRDHRIYDEILLPGAFHLALALAGVRQTQQASTVLALEEVLFPQALVLGDDETCAVQLILRPAAGETSFEMHSRSDDSSADSLWRLHAQGRIASVESLDAPSSLTDEMRARIQGRCAEQLSQDDFYARMRANHIDLGPTFQWHEQVWMGESEVLSRITQADARVDDLPLHPGLIDACFQTLIAGLAETYVPLEIERLRFWPQAGEATWCHARVRADDPPHAENDASELLAADVSLYDTQGTPVLQIKGLHLKRARRGSLLRDRKELDRWLYEIRWQQTPLAVEHAAASPGWWLVLADRGGFAAELARELENVGHRAVLLEALPSMPICEVLCDALGGSVSEPWRGVVHCWSLDSDAPDPFPRDTSAHETSGVPSSAAWSCASVLELVQQLAESAQVKSPRLHVLTRGAQSIGGMEMTEAGVAQSPLWGLGRVVAREFPEFRASLVDLDPAQPFDETRMLVEELLAADREDQVAYRDGRRMTPRLRALARGSISRPPAASDEEEPNVRLSIKDRGLLDNLRLQSVPRAKPRTGEVEIRVAAAGLNFRDVLGALGSYPGDPGDPGLECAGQVTAVGAGVQNVRVGDEVVAIAPGSFSRFVTTSALLAARKPTAFDAATAASLPVAFLTAKLALDHVAQLTAGQRVLIHAAAGGVGLAAVQVALRRGAVVIGSAGSHAKREYLRSLGVEMVVDSRSLEFAAEIRERYGEGAVDMVLNSLSGAAIAESLSLVRPGGAFVEIGKVGVWDEWRMAAARPDVKFARIALDTMFVEQPELIGSLLAGLLHEFEAGQLQAIPIKTFRLEEAHRAFRFMAQARHMGKIVVTTDRPRRAKAASAGLPAVRPDATYLVTGGLGHLGLRMARWLIGRGARHLVLVGRQAAGEEIQATLAELRSEGVDIRCQTLDVSRSQDVTRLVAQIDLSPAPLRGVFHAAGVLDDGMLVSQTAERFDRVFSPKVSGAWNLHQATESLPLDFFVMFSSLASLLGSPGQGNYAAANAFLDGLGHYRRGRGLAGLAVNWGPWAGGGMAGGLSAAAARQFESAGVQQIQPGQGDEAFDLVLCGPRPQVAVLPVDWERYVRQFSTEGRPALLDEVAPGAARERTLAAEQGPAISGEFQERIRHAAPDEACSILRAQVARHALRVLGLRESDALDPREPLADYGLDSLLAVELANILSRSIGCPVPTSLVFDHPTLDSLTQCLVERIAGVRQGHPQLQG